MKAFLVTLLALVYALPLRADNWLQNGDFTDGITHWYGDGKSPADFTPDNPLDKADAFTSKGMIIPLKSSHWAKVAQDFQGKVSHGVLSITYMVSPGLTFSDKPDDYINMPDHIGYDRWAAFNTPPGKWVIFISDLGSNRGAYYMVGPNLGSSTSQTFRAQVRGLTPLEDKTITLAFPPGSGNIVILDISLSDN